MDTDGDGTGDTADSDDDGDGAGDGVDAFPLDPVLALEKQKSNPNKMALLCPRFEFFERVERVLTFVRTQPFYMQGFLRL